MQIDLPPQLEALIRQKVDGGLYARADDVVAEGLRLLQRRDRLDELRLKRLHQLIEEGEADLREGRYVELGTDEELDAFFVSL